MKLHRLVYACCFVLAACSSTEERDTATEQRLLPVVSAMEATVFWGQRYTEHDFDQYNHAAPIVDNGRLYFATIDGVARCVEQETGKLCWKKQFDTGFTSGPFLADGRLLFGSKDAEVYVLNADDGKLLWTSLVSSEILSPPVLAGNRVIVQTGDGRVFGLDAKNGRQIWVYHRNVPLLSLRGTGVPIIDGEQVIVSLASGRLVALALNDGKLLWESSVTVAKGRSELARMVDIDGPAQLADGVIYVVTYQGRVAAISADAGRILWARDMSSHTGLTMHDKQLFLTDDEGRIWALDRETGATIWRQDELTSFARTRPVVFNNQLLVADATGTVYSLAQQDGKLLAKLESEDVLVSAGVNALPKDIEITDPLENFWDFPQGLAKPPLVIGQDVILSFRSGAIVSVRPRL